MLIIGNSSSIFDKNALQVKLDRLQFENGEGIAQWL